MKTSKTTTGSMGAAIAAMVCGFGLVANGALVVSHDSGLGVTDDPVSQWDDQSATGGDQDFIASTGTREPDLIPGATPLGEDALRFDGVANNPDQMVFGATSTFDAAPSLTFMMVLKPNTSVDTSETYLQTEVTNQDRAWGLYHDNSSGFFYAQARSTSTAFDSTIADAGLGGLDDDWMILSGVYNGSTIQLFLTDADGTLHSGSATTVTGGLANGTHEETFLATDLNRVNAAAADIAAVRIWDEALSPSAREAVELTLANTYFLAAPVPEPGTLALMVMGAALLSRCRRNRS